MVLRAVGEIALEKSVVPDDSGYRRVRSEGSTDDTDYYYNNACDDLKLERVEIRISKA
jgi:hypothetical protein